MVAMLANSSASVALLTALQQTIAELQGSHHSFCIAYSGGIDSHVLLDAMAQLAKQNPSYKLRAIYVNHQLSPNADAWQQHCRTTCQQLSVPFSAHAVKIEKSSGESLENLARQARYRCLAEQLQTQECLLTAHHADDQAETVLLQLLRGSGVAGLAAMPIKKTFARGLLLRPLLTSSRCTLEQYAQQRQLQWIEDESNHSTIFNRNYLRHHVMPTLKKRWPQLTHTISRSAQHCANANTLIQQLAKTELIQTSNQNGNIDVRQLRLKSLEQQHEILRCWIQQQHFSLPSEKQLNEIMHSVVYSRYDASPCFRWAQQEMRRYRHLLYLLHPSTTDYQQLEILWNGEDVITLPHGDVKMIFHNKQQLKRDCLSFPCSVRFGYHGERIRIAAHGKSKSLKQLFQCWEIPPWERGRIPLLYHKQQLIGVVGYAIAAAYQR